MTTGEFIVILNCILPSSLVTLKVFSYLLFICIFSPKKCPCFNQITGGFCMFLFVCLFMLLCLVPLVFWKLILYQVNNFQIFLRFRRPCPYSVDFFLCCTKAFSLISCHFLIIAFIPYAFGVISKKPLPRPISVSIFPMLSSNIFIVLHLIFKFLIHFELALLWKTRIRFQSSAGRCSVFQHHLSKKLSFLQCMFFLPWLKMNWLQIQGLSSLFCFIRLFFVLCLFFITVIL